MWPNPQEIADVVTFTEEILNAKLHFLCSTPFVIITFSHAKIGILKSSFATRKISDETPRF